MRYLIVEDRPEKAEEIISAIKAVNIKYEISTCEKETKDILKNDKKYDLILLDMAFPKSHSGRVNDNKYGGINILNFMKIFKIHIPVIVISIYWDFNSLSKPEPELANRVYYNSTNSKQDGEPSNKMNNLEDLNTLMSYRFENYIGAIQYSEVNNAWKNHIIKMIKEIKNEHSST